MEKAKDHKWGICYTFGDSRGAVNLIGNILEGDYRPYRQRVMRLLSKQHTALSSVMAISNKTIREATLEMWHKRFVGLLEGLPDVVESHVLCVETGYFRKLLAQSRREVEPTIRRATDRRGY